MITLISYIFPDTFQLHELEQFVRLCPSLLFELAARNDIALPSTSDDPFFASTSTLADRYNRFTSLDDFLHYYFIGMSCLIYAQDFENLAWSYFQRAKADGVVHAEVSFDPQAHTSRGIKYETVIEGFSKACERAEKDLGISTKLILCFMRHLPVKDSVATWEKAQRDFGRGLLAGIGLDSSEKGFPPGQWKDIYKEAKNTGIRRTAHAGEEGPVEYIEEALRQCYVERIDHGIRLVDDEDLMKEVAEKNILVTICPLSNVKLQCIKHVRELPIRRFLDAGVQFSINSDDPAYFTSYIQDNYCAIQDEFDLSVDDWCSIAKAAIYGSWCDDERKNFIHKQVDAAAEAAVQREGEA
ncbi:MAG: hypothetical protein Q9164_000161 [Protoblastenia rupestris]